jgi:hypothetical protein
LNKKIKIATQTITVGIDKAIKIIAQIGKSFVDDYNHRNIMKLKQRIQDFTDEI